MVLLQLSASGHLDKRLIITGLVPDRAPGDVQRIVTASWSLKAVEP